MPLGALGEFSLYLSQKSEENWLSQLDSSI